MNQGVSICGVANPPLKIIIVGAGIAGLSSAIALRRAGHDVEIFEQSSFADEVGAAIQLPPNAMRVLSRWGFCLERARLEICGAALTARADTLEPIYQATFSHFSAKYGSPWYSSHRVDLHNELKFLATEVEGAGRPARINLAAKVVEIDPDTATITLASNTKHSADLIIAANGIHTNFLRHILPSGGESTPVATGASAFRFLISTSDLITEENNKQYLDKNALKIFVGEGSKRLVWYPCRGGEVQNFVGIHPDEESSQRHEDWTASSSKEHLLEVYKDFHPTLLKVMQQASVIKVWPLLHREPLPTWHKSRLLFIGDAAHPMLPHQGQAGAQAIEDACALGLLFGDISTANIEQRLKLYEKVRMSRTQAMQIFSRWGQDQADRVRREVESIKGWTGDVPTNPTEFQTWNFEWDVFEECSRAVKEDQFIKDGGSLVSAARDLDSRQAH